ncbi:hypothetical protein [Candidatus Symbiobacter mobilis]|uniref:Uncharacterized protein n=1 Tax=Candidatus Symbiobacter mobilis CR TaxID=946483 RepID=U5N9M1_9BURK|nr:hypothetical protein [Candidatus Symbiobacter mobilis]AGX86938.1 hypothetical protein Cenrod_0833 [Candidatus Symbiobacter mobilis CR]
MFREICLVCPNDKHYRKWLKDNNFISDPKRIPCPFAHEYHLQLYKLENIIRSIIKLHLEECPNRILQWNNRNKYGRYRIHYRELDYVYAPDQTPRLFIEIKHRETTTTGKDGIAQIKKSLFIAQHAWQNVSGVCINVMMADILGIETDIIPDFIPLTEIPTVLASESQPHDEIHVLWLDSKEVATFAIEHGLLTKEEVDDLPRLHKLARNPTKYLNTEFE